MVAVVHVQLKEKFEEEKIFLEIFAGKTQE